MGTNVFSVFQIIVGGSSFHIITFHSDSHLGPVSSYPSLMLNMYLFCHSSLFLFPGIMVI